MPSSFDRIVVHTVFSTKYRHPFIDDEIEESLHLIISRLLVDQGCTVLEINGMPDHIHILHTLPRTKSISSVMRIAKSQSCDWARNQHPERYEHFAWQDGYAVFSVDYRKLEKTRLYIQNQKFHHGACPSGAKPLRIISYRTELLSLFKAYGIKDYDTNYLFPRPPAA
ncbi:IS200/IS605 family transposase [Lewinella sp. 4G2]|uniref:IS200/IS605 family transposase n=1 Tax=Lewinella sp. 4G2 TaxID=1803372 RepID=UPI0007B4C764|nr:IS200/IS605 family transposase [Lewinella sp. 4G2]OAV43939.1 hypothetical protein A3850_005275 [Lewinella sp. 4G2]